MRLPKDFQRLSTLGAGARISPSFIPNAGQTRPGLNAGPARPSAVTADHGPISYGSWGAGYVADAPAGHVFTAISTRFLAPPASSAPRTDGWVAIWAGIGLQALDGGQLMQAGILVHSTAAGTWDAVRPWWINEPSTPTEPHLMALAIHPGDVVEVNVGQVDAGDWAFTVADITTGASSTGSCTGCRSDGLTAAWVMEDPLSSSGAGQTGFADPGTLTFLTAAASVDGGALTPLDLLDWHPLLRTAVGQEQGPVGSGPSAAGGFTLQGLPPGSG